MLGAVNEMAVSWEEAYYPISLKITEAAIHEVAIHEAARADDDAVRDNAILIGNWITTTTTTSRDYSLWTATDWIGVYVTTPRARLLLLLL